MSTDAPHTPRRCPACSCPLSLALGRRPPARCPGCGTALDRAPASAAPEPGAALLIQGTTDDDGRPYGVFGDVPPPPCPSCGQSPNRGDTICRHCDTDLATGQKAVRTCTPVDHEWEAGWPLRRRRIAFFICLGINVATVVLSLMVRGSAPVTFVGFVVACALQAFLLGTFDRLSLTRTPKGKITLIKSWRIAFVPLAPTTIRWREHESVVVRHSEVGCLEWVILLALVPTVLPALLWWWFAIRSGRFIVSLTQSLGDPVTPLYFGTDEDRAEEIAQTVSEVTGLPFDRS